MSRESIEASLRFARYRQELANKNVARLEAELAEIPAGEITIHDAAELGTITLTHGRGTLEICSTRPSGGKAQTNFFCASDAAALRDWLNYHFPKTEENA